jgi:hypothetical protein
MRRAGHAVHWFDEEDGSSINRGGRIVYLRTSLNMIPMNYAIS